MHHDRHQSVGPSEYTTPQFSREKDYTIYPDYTENHASGETPSSIRTPEWPRPKVKFSTADSVASEGNNPDVSAAKLPFMYHYSGDETRCSGLDFLAMACNTFSLQGDADIVLDAEQPMIKTNEMWRPW